MAKTTLIFSQLRLRHDDGHVCRYTRAHFARLEGLCGLGIAAGAGGLGGAMLYLLPLSGVGGVVVGILIAAFLGLIFSVGMIFGLVQLLKNITIEVDGDRREVRVATGVGPLRKRQVFPADQIKHVAVGEASTEMLPTPDNETYYRTWLAFKEGQTPETWELEESKKLDPPLSVARQVAERLGVPLEADTHESARLHDATAQVMADLFPGSVREVRATEATTSPPPVRRIEVREDRPDRLSLVIHPMGLFATRSVWVRFLFGLPFLGFGAIVGLAALATWQSPQDVETGGIWAAALFSLAFVSVGLGVSINNLMRMWRSAVIDLGAGGLTVRESLVVLSRTHQWPLEDVDGITVDHGSTDGTPLCPPFRLCVSSRGGEEAAMLKGRSPMELAWIAKQLSSRLGVPSNADQIATFKA